jgi:hypothetical protein
MIVAATGVAMIVLGAAIAFGAFSWFGRLPGDIRYDGDRVKVYAPIVSMLLISILLSAVLFVAGRLR